MMIFVDILEPVSGQALPCVKRFLCLQKSVTSVTESVTARRERWKRVWGPPVTLLRLLRLYPYTYARPRVWVNDRNKRNKCNKFYFIKYINKIVVTFPVTVLLRCSVWPGFLPKINKIMGFISCE